MKRHAAIACLWISPLAGATDPRLEFARGVLAECRGQNDRAAAHFEAARIADPVAAPLVERAVSRLLAAGDRAGAIRLYQDFARARPNDLSAQLGYADFLTEQGRGDSLALKLARETLDAALAKHPGDPEVIRRLFSLDRSSGEGLLEMLSPDDPVAVLLYVSMSRSLHDEADTAARGRIDQRFEAALAKHPGHPVLAREASEHFRSTGRLDQAIDVLKRHAAAAPWSLDLRVRRGILLFSAKWDDEGEQCLLDVLAIHPRKALAHQALAKFHRLRGNPDRAGFHAGELLKIRGGAPSEFIALADAELSAKRPREARLLLEKAVFAHPGDVELRKKLAVATHRDPETRGKAARLFREAEAAAPDGRIDDPVFLTASAEVLIESGQSKAAEERLRAAIRAYPVDAKKETAAALRRLAALWNSENRNADAARALLLRADTLAPEER